MMMMMMKTHQRSTQAEQDIEYEQEKTKAPWSYPSRYESGIS
jgi:hypothetical protein